MLSWLRRRRERAERVEAEAERLMREHSCDAYGEARRREQEAKSKLEAKVWGRAAQAIAQETATRFDLNNATRTALDADLVTVREAVPSPSSFVGPDPNNLGELIHVISGGSAPGEYRIQFLGAGTDRGLRVLEEVGVHATDVPRAIRQAIHIAWPPQAIGFRLFDHEGREVFRRQNDDPYS